MTDWSLSINRQLKPKEYSQKLSLHCMVNLHLADNNDASLPHSLVEWGTCILTLRGGIAFWIATLCRAFWSHDIHFSIPSFLLAVLEAISLRNCLCKSLCPPQHKYCAEKRRATPREWIEYWNQLGIGTRNLSNLPHEVGNRFSRRWQSPVSFQPLQLPKEDHTVQNILCSHYTCWVSNYC